MNIPSDLPTEVSNYFKTHYPNQRIDVKYCRVYGNMNVVDFTISDMFFRTTYIPIKVLA